MLDAIRSTWKRLTTLLRKPPDDAELNAELGAHLEALTQQNIRRGMSADEAHHAARREFGNIEKTKVLYREQRSLPFIEMLFQDIRFAMRVLKSNPGVTLVAVISLAVGIGGNAAMFSMVRGLLLRPLPYQKADQLVAVTGFYPKGAFAAMRQSCRTMELAAYTLDSQFNLTGRGEALRVPGSSVSENLFSVLGTQPELGATFRSGDNQPGRDHLVILSHSLWRARFNADPRIIGTPIMIDGVARQVAAVMPAGFTFPSSDVQIWVPLHMDPTSVFDQWNTGFMPLLGRLRGGFTIEQAQKELRPLIFQTIPLFPYKMPRAWNSEATAISLQRSLVGNMRTKLLVLQFAIGLVLLITCANVASLLLSRASAREKEMALRTALGAARGRIVRQLLTESLVLAMLGGGLGLALAFGLLDILKSAVSTTTPGLAQVRLDGTMLGFVTVLALLTGLAFGLFPALSASRADLAGAIRVGGRRSGGSVSHRLRGMLVAGETALAVLLAVSAGLLIKSLWLLTQVNPGFQPARVVTAGIYPNPSLCQNRTACIAFYEEVVRRAHEISGVSDAAAANVVPLSAEVPEIPVEMEGHPIIAGQTLAPMVWAGAVTPEYFQTMRIPLMEGRTFENTDGEKNEPVIVVSEETARRYWPNESAVGKHIRAVWDNEPWRTVVGVVGDVRQYDLAGNSRGDIQGAVYMPYPQAVGIDRHLPTSMAILLRTDAGEADTAARLRELVSEINPNVPVAGIRTMKGIVSSSLLPSRSLMWLFLSFAATALLLAAIGTYGVISYSTSQRFYEMGVRMALGATPARIFHLVIGQSLRLALAGLAAGILASLALTRALSAFLYGVTTHDPLTFAAVAAILILIALLAGFVPARRAASVDPMVALRHD